MKKLLKFIYKTDLLFSLAAFILALLISGIIISLSGYSPWEAYVTMTAGAFGSPNAVAKTLAKATPLIFTGLAVAFSFKGGLFNIGAEGQLYMGGFAAALVGIYVQGLPGILHLFLAVVAAGIVGGLWSTIAGYLKIKRGTHEVIVTIMLNYIAIFLTNYFVSYPFKAEGMIPRTEELPASLQLTRLLPHSQLTTGLLMGIAFALIVAWFMKNTVYGYEIKAMGFNQDAAEAGGVNLKRGILLTMFISGFLAAMAGVTEVLGVHGYFIKGFSPGYGYDGMAVAVMGRNNPLGVVVSAILFGALRSGGMLLDRVTDIPGDFVVIIQALVIIFIATPAIIKKVMKKKERRQGNGN